MGGKARAHVKMASRFLSLALLKGCPVSGAPDRRLAGWISESSFNVAISRTLPNGENVQF